MINFACKQCGKRFQRPDETAGTLVFCACGTGNRVPWESTVAAEETAPPAAAREPAPPRVLPAPRPEPESDFDFDRPRRRSPVVRSHDPAYCFNHEDVPSEKKCTDCGEAFCAGCVVGLQGQTLCGPCKNYRIRRLLRPPRMSTLSILALIGAVVAGGASFFLVLMGIGAAEASSAGGAFGVLVTFGIMALLAQLIVAGLAGFGLYDVEKHPRVSGRAAAMSALVTVLGSTILLGALVVLYIRNVL